MISRRFLGHLLIIMLGGTPLTHGQSVFSPGDWQSWRDCRGARALDATPHEVFVATGGGVLAYEISRARWEAPQVMGYGMFESVPIDDAILLLHDERYDQVWVATRDKLLKWHRGFERWEIAAQNVWTIGERPVNIGVGDQTLYVETIPDRIYDRLFVEHPPLPSPDWVQYVRRYSGNRSSGALFLDSGMRDGEAQIRWRGLRTKEKLPDSAYPQGVIGQLPAGFPFVLPPKPYTWHGDGTLYDPRGRSFPVTDWMLDSWGNFWSTHWGAGVLRTDLHSLRSEQLLAGPAGNDMRALLFLDHELWMGGANDREFTGVSIFHGYGTGWSYFERRDDGQIRSTDVNDFAFAGERIWLGTADGLLSYLPHKKLWKRYDVQDNLPEQEARALVAQDSLVWIGTRDGLAVLDTRSNQITRVPAPGFALNGINDLALLDSTLFVGTNGGLTRVHTRTHAVDLLDVDPGLINLQVEGLSLHGSTLWLVTPQGIMSRAADGSTKSWLSVVWMKNAILTCIEASDPYVWVGTESGMFRFDPARGAWDQYTRRDGLVDDFVQVIREDRGDLWIGTRGGLSRYYWSRPGATK